MKLISRDKAKAIGLKRYFTGKPCPKGHVSYRFVSTFGCCDCLSEINLEKNKGVKRHHVTSEHILRAAISCESYSDFRTTYPKEYGIASKRGLLDIIRGKLGMGATSKRWDKESCVLEAKKYSTRSEFSKQSSGAYDAAHKLGILQLCCSHMGRPSAEANVFYFWGGEVSGRVISKVGITSARLGRERVLSVSKKYGGPVDFCFAVYSADARKIEEDALKVGDIFNPGKINGASEFRVMTWGQVAQIYNLMMEAN